MTIKVWVKGEYRDIKDEDIKGLAVGNRNLHCFHIYELLGLNPKSHLPASLPARYIGDTQVWIVTPESVGYQKGRSVKHRVFAACPHCLSEMPAGRLHQHIGTKKCKNSQQDLNRGHI